MPIQLHDAVSLSGTRRTDDGYLVAEARVARTGIQEYDRSDLGLDGAGKVRVYRPEGEVFAQDAMASYAHRPVTVEHPAEMVTADNWRRHAVGQTGDEVARDGDFVRVPLVLMDAAAIKQVEEGRRELSMGYSLEIEMRDGVTPEGQAYDAVQKNLRMNHLAIVARARGGSDLKIGDNHSARNTDMADNAIKTRTVLVDGLSVECTDAGAQAIEKLQKQITDAESGHQTAISAKDKEIGEKDAEIDKLKGQVLDASALDKRVAERSSLIDGARKVAKDVKTEGQSDADIRRSVVAAKLGDAAVDGRSDEYIAARFDGLVEAAATDSANDPLKAPIKQTARDGDPWGADVFGSAGVKMKKEA